MSSAKTNFNKDYDSNTHYLATLETIRGDSGFFHYTATPTFSGNKPSAHNDFEYHTLEKTATGLYGGTWRLVRTTGSTMRDQSRKEIVQDNIGSLPKALKALEECNADIKRRYGGLRHIFSSAISCAKASGDGSLRHVQRALRAQGAKPF